jgi:hypothetical protein
MDTVTDLNKATAKAQPVAAAGYEAPLARCTELRREPIEECSVPKAGCAKLTVLAAPRCPVENDASHASRVDEAVLVLFDLIERNEVVVLARKNQNVDINARRHRRHVQALNISRTINGSFAPKTHMPFSWAHTLPGSEFSPESKFSTPS